MRMNFKIPEYYNYSKPVKDKKEDLVERIVRKLTSGIY